MKTGGKRGVIGGINITPLTDIFLVLLIIMMLLPIIEMKELQINIRAATSAQTDSTEKPKTFEMSVLADKFTVSKEEVGADALEAKLKEAAEKAPDGLVINVANDSRHEQLAQALAAAKRAQIMKVAVKRIKEETAKAPDAKAAPAKPAAKGK